MIRRRAERARIDDRGVGGIDDQIVDKDRAGHVPFRLEREFIRRQQALGLGVGKADRDAVDRRVGVERQPGRARLGDGDLRDQQFRPTRHPQADDVARPDAACDQSARDAGRQRVDLGVIVDALQGFHCGVMGAMADRVGEDFRKQFVAQMLGRDAPHEHRFGGGRRGGAILDWREIGGCFRKGCLGVVHPASAGRSVALLPARSTRAGMIPRLKATVQLRRRPLFGLQALAHVWGRTYPAPRVNAL